MADAESISLEETNKIRIKLGLKPLTDDGPSSNSKDKEAEDNYAKRKEQQAKERETRLVAPGCGDYNLANFLSGL